MAALFCLRFPPPVILLNNQQEFGISAVGFLREPVVTAMAEGIMKSKALSCPLQQNAAVSNATDLLFSLSPVLAFRLRIPVSYSGEYPFDTNAFRSLLVCLLDARNTLRFPGCCTVVALLFSCLSTICHRGGCSQVVLSSPGPRRLFCRSPGWMFASVDLLRRMPLLILSLPSFLPEFCGVVQHASCLSFYPFSRWLSMLFPVLSL